MSLEDLRKEIDEADRELLRVFEKRIGIAERIGVLKRQEGKPVSDPTREKEKISSLQVLAGDQSREYIDRLYRTIFEVTKEHEEKKIFGVLGRSLPHTYSPEIHHAIAPEYLYVIIEKEPDELDRLFEEKKYGGFNVTIPYKIEAANRCDVLAGDAEAIGAVNTVVFGEDGKTYGYNTDVFGFEFMLKEKGIDPAGMNCLILGHGGASAAVEAALKKAGAAKISFVSRSGDINYENVYDICSDTDIVINATPVGMYPDIDKQAADLKRFPSLKAFADLIYNPGRTKMMLQAEELGIRCAGGLSMLVAQAYKASSIFRGIDEIDEDEAVSVIRNVTSKMRSRMENITFIGMPGCGKSTLARAVADSTGREFIDLDLKYTEVYGETPSVAISKRGEEVFRTNETAVAREVLPQSGKVISCGGGIVTRDENYLPIRANSRVIYVKRPLDVLASEDRPITARDGVTMLYEQRRARYEELADITIEIPKTDSSEEFIAKAIRQLREAGVEV